jgi:cell wall-associated NlpC family hydrolase
MPLYNDLIGRPFKDGGRGPEYDCWGLVREVYLRNGVVLPDFAHSALDIISVGAEIEKQRHMPRWESILAPAKLCIVLIRFNSPITNHCGVYLGKDKFIHAREKVGVNIDRTTAPSWAHRIEGFYVPA